MLSVLRIQNLAIIENLEIEFSEGFNAITGETGAGKSILLKAIGLLCGEKASPDMTRSNASQAEVEGLFYVSQEDIAELSSTSLDTESFGLCGCEEIILRRVVDKSGKSKALLNGKMISKTTLEQVGRLLIDITGQHHQQRILNSDIQMNLLDEFAENGELLESVSLLFTKYSQAKRRLEQWNSDSSRILAEIEQKNWCLEELDKAALSETEEIDLGQSERKLGSIQELGELVSQSLSILEEEHYSAINQVSCVRENISKACALDPSLHETLALIESARVELSEAKISLEHYNSSLESDPQLLDNIRSRLGEISSIKRKYKMSVDQLISHREALRQDILSFNSSAFDQQQFELEVQSSLNALINAEDILSKKRKDIANHLAHQTTLGLRELEMKRAEFSVSVSEKAHSPNGADRIEFMISPNPGEELKPLSKIASGGELSRVTLILKSTLNDKRSPKVQIYDEVDAGVGGRAAQAIGEKLAKLGRSSQVIAVTHSPQVAALANTHIMLKKDSSESSTQTTAHNLDSAKRTDEIARMLAGKNVSEKFLESARELIALGSRVSC